MFRKLVFVVAAMLLFVVTGTLSAQELIERDKTEQSQTKVQQRRRKGASRQKGLQGTGQRKNLQAKQKAVTKTGNMGNRPQVNRTRGQKADRAPMFQRWFSGMKKAHRENDMEKIGQLLETMERQQQQIRKRWQANTNNNRQSRQRTMKRSKGANRRRSWARSDSLERQRLGSYPRSRTYGVRINEGDRHRRNNRPRERKSRRGHGRRGYYRS
ncbi:MAG: hypothetical protein ACYTE8_06180 [Planctomycetota bacterium]|jgi:hypothetical protein